MWIYYLCKSYGPATPAIMNNQFVPFFRVVTDVANTSSVHAEIIPQLHSRKLIDILWTGETTACNDLLDSILFAIASGDQVFRIDEWEKKWQQILKVKTEEERLRENDWPF